MVRLFLIVACLLIPAVSRGAEDLRLKIRELVTQLDARSLAERKSAESALIELGSAALAHLPTSNRRLSAEARDRLARVRKTLEQQQAKKSIEPSLFSYVELGEKMPLAIVLKELADSSDNHVYLPKGDGPRVEANFEETPYWVALDQVLDEAGMTIYPFADKKGYRVESRVDSLRPRSERAAYSGAFRFEPTTLELRSDLRQAKGRSLRVKLQTAWEPRLAPIAIGLKPDSLKATDDAGNKIAIDSSTSASAVAVRAGTMQAELDIALVPPSRTTRRIAKLGGNISVLMPTRRVKFEFDALESDRARRERVGAVSVTLDKVRKIDDEWQIDLGVQFKDASSGLESHLDWESKDRAYVIGPDDQKVLPSRRENQREGDSVRRSYWFKASGDLAKYRLVYEVPSDIVELTVPFELKDLPLP